MRLKDQVALVTGAAGGIGRACAERFAAEGAKVVLADLDRDRGEAAAAAIRDQGLEARFQACDVSRKDQVEAAVAAAVAAYGRLDCAIANAGIVRVADFLELSEEDFDQVLAVNLKGVFLTGQAAARQMVAQGPAPRGEAGSIINMSSINAIVAIPNILPYVVAKGGVNQLTKAMALALADKGVRVNAVGPGSIATEMVLKVASDKAAMNRLLSRTPMGRLGEPAEIAAAALFLASADASYMTGQTIYPDGGRLGLNYTVPVPD